MNKIEVNGVTDTGLKKILLQYDLSDDLKNGKITCLICGNILMWDTIGGVIHKDDTLRLICDNNECIELFQKSQ
jgi:hypothetical protein